MAITMERLGHVGGSALTGWRGAAGRAIAKPVSQHSRFSQQQVESVIGLALLVYAIYTLSRTMVRVVRDER